MRAKLSHTTPKFIREVLFIFSILFLMMAIVLFMVVIGSTINHFINPEEAEIKSECILWIIIASLFAGGLYSRSQKNELIEYNTKFLYITKDGVEEIIELSNIIEIKADLFGTSNGKKIFYYIKYRSADGKIKEVDVNVIYHQQAMEKFKMNVQKAKLNAQ